MRILVAEDDGTSRLLLSHLLKAAGHEVVAVADGARALEAYRRQQPAVVITDWQMPELDGLELVQRIRAQRSERYPWLIMLTAREFKTNYALTMKAGVDDYLTKPLDRDLLLVRLEVARRVVELNQEVSLLKRVIPLCMICHAVRDTSERWTELDQYFRHQTGVDFSHGFCPDCFFEKSVLPYLEQHETSRARALPQPLVSDVAAHLAVVGERLAAGLERKGAARQRTTEAPCGSSASMSMGQSASRIASTPSPSPSPATATTATTAAATAAAVEADEGWSSRSACLRPAIAVRNDRLLDEGGGAGGFTPTHELASDP